MRIVGWKLDAAAFDIVAYAVAVLLRRELAAFHYELSMRNRARGMGGGFVSLSLPRFRYPRFLKSWSACASARAYDASPL